MNDSNFTRQMAIRQEGVGYDTEVAPTRVRRDGLVSELLQDRKALRVVSAPHGFGKTELASEYATRLFAERDVVWVDAASPDFIRWLDEDGRRGFGRLSERPSLVVIDGLPYLDEVRAEALSRAIDRYLYDGVEVLVTTIPSHDCLESLQPERLLVKAPKMLVSEAECKPDSALDVSAMSVARLSAAWRKAKTTAFGRVPVVFWGKSGNEFERCAKGLFSEKLPLEMLRTMFCMLLLGEGVVEDLERAGCGMRAETERMLFDDYPLFGFDPVRKRFAIPAVELPAVRTAIEVNGLAEAFLAGTYSLPQRALDILFAKNELGRAEAVLDCFCTDEQCAAWLQEQGWNLLDRGNSRFVEALFQRCTDEEITNNTTIIALHAWLRGLAGNWREASRDAKRVFALVNDPASDETEAVAYAAAKLALAAFGNEETLPGERIAHRALAPVTSAELFLSIVTGICSEVELKRALSVDDSERSKALESLREPAQRERVDQLSALFTEFGFRLKGSLFFRLSLHLLSFVDSTDLRRLVQDLGCDEVIAMRRHGVKSISAALLVRDLWTSGYFGPLGRAVDKRDAQLLESSSALLKKMSVHAGYDRVVIPWEIESAGSGQAASVYIRGAVRRNEEGVPLLRVRLFGGFEVSVGDRFVDERRWRRKARQLFTELVLHQGRDISRDEILKLLWPSVSRARALDSFYSLWSNMCAVVDNGPYLERSGDFCRVNPRYVVSDVAEFEQLTRSLLMDHDDPQMLLDSYARIESLYCGGLLPCDRGSVLVQTQRERYRAMYTDAMVAATNGALGIGDSRLALWFARKGMEVEQKREDVYIALIRAQIAAGQRCSAIRTYFKCKEFLREDLGLDPSAQTRELYEHLIAVDPSLTKLSAASFET